MRCIITAGPTYEEVDQVRRLTNFSTGRLGSELTNYLTSHGHECTLLIGQQSSWRGERTAAKTITFSTTDDLKNKLASLAGAEVQAVYHAAAVSDFKVGKVFRRQADGPLIEDHSGKFETREGSLLVELIPTEKIIHHLHDWFPKAHLVGWKYEVHGFQKDVIQKAIRQLQECQSHLCVVNGPAYGSGFGVVDASGLKRHCNGPAELFQEIGKL